MFFCYKNLFNLLQVNLNGPGFVAISKSLKSRIIGHLILIENVHMTSNMLRLNKNHLIGS